MVGLCGNYALIYIIENVVQKINGYLGDITESNAAILIYIFENKFEIFFVMLMLG